MSFERHSKMIERVLLWFELNVCDYTKLNKEALSSVVMLFS